MVGLALGVAFFISGHGFAKFERTLKQFLGISCVSKNRYYDIVKLVYPHITAILDQMCEEEKNRMKDKDAAVLGSWKKPVVTSDGVWHTRGHFSKNGSFIKKNYLTGGLLWYGHKCMRGKDVIDEELYAGTAKSMEGVLAGECYKQAKEEGCHVNTVWQDGDSSSAKSVTEYHSNSKVYKCGGHVGRAHTNNLKEAAKKKEFSNDIAQKFKDKFPNIKTLKCKCGRHKSACGCLSETFIKGAHTNNLKEAAKKKEFSNDITQKFKDKFPNIKTLKCKCGRHKSGCGCLSETFIKGAHINHFCILQQCKIPEDYAEHMRVVSQYHCRDIHSWDEGSCGFHPQCSCSCNQCDENEEPSCEGKEYHT